MEMEYILKEIIENIDPEGLFRRHIDFQSCILIMPSQSEKLKIAFWDANEQVVVIECFGFVPVQMNLCFN